MQHLPVPDELQSRLPQIPHLRHGPLYDRQGFDGFLERVGVDENELLSYLTRYNHIDPDPNAKPKFTREVANSLIQEWCWFGLLHEFEKSCGVPMNSELLVSRQPDSQLPILDTSLLPGYVRSALIKRAQDLHIPLDLQPRDRVQWKHQCIDNRIFEVVRFQDPFHYVLEDVETRGQVINMVPAPILERLNQRTTDSLENHQTSSNNSICSAKDNRCLSDLLNYDKRARLEWPELFCVKPVPAFFKYTMRIHRVLQDLDICNSQSLYDEIYSSLIVLGDSVARASKHIFGDLLPFGIPVSKIGCPPEWCPSRRRLLGSAYPILSQFANIIPSFDTDNHSACSDYHCVFRISAFVMKPLHTPTCDEHTCKDAKTDESQLIDILENGGNPCLLLAQQNGNDSLTIADTRKTDYVAISHVWAHGLGNPEKTSLPWCQVRKLFDHIRCSFSKTVALWIDTLTVPTTPSHKHKAIMSLRDVYRNAEAVLVLDKHLQQVGPHPFERALQILGCEWMTRLWTLSESRLASNLVFLFRDAAVPLARIIDEIDLFSDRGVFMPWSFANDLARFFRNPTDITERFAELLKNLANRNVTDSGDEPICLATLLGLRLEDLGPNITLAAIYKAIPNSLPLDLLFVPTQRLDEPGLRWAPSTFLGGHIFGAREKYRSGSLDQRGFHVVFDCILLDFHPELLNHGYIFADLDESDHGGFLLEKCSPGASPFCQKVFEEAAVQAQNDLRDELPQMAVLIRKPRKRTLVSLTTAPLVMLTHRPGLESSGTRACIYLTRVYVKKREEMAMRLRELGSDEVLEEIAMEFQEQQKFCFVE